MMTVHEVSALTGLSVRTLQYYDRIGLLKPAAYSDAGYRLYDRACLEKLQEIMLFRELEFPLQEIRRILASPGFDREKALAQQIELLTLKKEHLEDLIRFADGLRQAGGTTMDFTAFDTSKLEAYAAEAKAQWGDTAEYKAFAEKAKDRSKEEDAQLAGQLMEIFAAFGKVKDRDPESEEAQALVARLQQFISAHYYPCSVQVLRGLGTMYAAGGDFTKNIDAAGGEGTAVFADKAIRAYCRKNG